MALKQAGVEKGSVLIAGVDGTPDGLRAVKKGDLTVSVFQDAKGQADGSIDTAVKMIKHEPVEQAVWVPYRLITPDNVDLPAPFSPIRASTVPGRTRSCTSDRAITPGKPLLTLITSSR